MIAGVPSPSVPIHWSPASTVVSPSEVAKTVVAAFEPRLPTIFTVVVIVEPVELVNVSTVRAKSWPPVLGTVTLRETVNPATVPPARMRLCPLSTVLEVGTLALTNVPSTYSRPSPLKALLSPLNSRCWRRSP